MPIRCFESIHNPWKIEVWIKEKAPKAKDVNLQAGDGCISLRESKVQGAGARW